MLGKKEIFTFSLVVLLSSLLSMGDLFALAFKPHVDYPAGTGPISIAAGDFNGDKYPDLAVANQMSNNVSILINKGDGTFGTATNYGAGTAPFGVTVADFNGDGCPDLAVANSQSSNVSILLNIVSGNVCTGTFGAAINSSAGTRPVSIVAADFNGDKMQDVAVTNETMNVVSVLLGNGNGTFAAPRTFAVGTSPESVAVGDFNNDGFLDLVTANNGSNNVSVLQGNGDGTFTRRPDVTVGIFTYAVAVGQFRPTSINQDLGVAQSLANQVSSLLGNGNGTFGTLRSYAASAPISVAVGDFNFDGKQDLVTTTSTPTTSSATVLLGNGDGTFQAAQNFTVGTAPESVAVADFNLDGKPDIATANHGSNDVSILINGTCCSPSRH